MGRLARLISSDDYYDQVAILLGSLMPVVVSGSQGGTGQDTSAQTGTAYLTAGTWSFRPGRVAPTYGVTVAIDASAGSLQSITVTDGVAFAIGAPTNPTTGQTLTIMVRNTSGGAVGVITWNAVYHMVAFTNPANGFSQSVTFQYDGADWVEITRTTADVPN
jgi:hypothetical protein